MTHLDDAAEGDEERQRRDREPGGGGRVVERGRSAIAVVAVVKRCTISGAIAAAAADFAVLARGEDVREEDEHDADRAAGERAVDAQLALGEEGALRCRLVVERGGERAAFERPHHP